METFVFYIFWAAAVVSLWMMLRTSNIVQAISWFAIFLVIVAIFFGLLKAPFLALGQLVVFTGGMIAILLIGISFSGMESGVKPDATAMKEMRLQEMFRNRWNKLAIMLFLLTLLVSIKMFLASDPAELPVRLLAGQVFGMYWPMTTFILLMFLAALLSAIYFLKNEN